MSGEMKRARVTGITIDLQYPNGETRTVKIDPRTTTALFWDEDSVKKILAPYYDKRGAKPAMTRGQLTTLFGRIGEKIAGDQNSIKVTGELIQRLWDETDNKGNSVPILAKSIFCLPAPGGDSEP